MKKLFCRAAALLMALSLVLTPAAALSVDEALELLEDSYLRDIPAEAYEAGTLDELFSLLGDPYTYYMTAEQYAAFLTGVEGETSVVGIGVSIQYTNDGVLILSVLDGGPAEDAGLVPGDLIIAVDGLSCVPADETVQSRITGQEGTDVTLTVRHADGTEEDYTLTRRLVVILNTQTQLLDGHVAYLDCDSFGTDTGDLFADCVLTYYEQADCWLVDVRSNPGGVSSSAVSAVGAFAGVGTYLYLQNSSGGLFYYFYLADSPAEGPVVVVTSATSASASEIFAAGIRDTGVGIVVGERTYGKGVAQIVLTQDESDYFDGDAMKVTAYRFYTGSGNTTDLIGVIPTLLVPGEYAYNVALALCGQREWAAGRLRLELAGQTFYIDPAETDAAVLSALFAALPPSAQLSLGTADGQWQELSITQAAAALSLAYDSLWFTDLADSPYADQINTLAVYGLLLGVGDGSFQPDGSLTRAQLCAILSRLLNVTYTGSSRFTDVADGAWYSGAVNAMAELGLVQGVGDGRFLPDDPLTWEQLCAILSRTACYLNFAVDSYAASLTEDDLTGLDGYSDWAKPELATLSNAAQETLGSEQSMLAQLAEALAPQDPVSRGQTAAALYQMLSALGILTA